MYPEYKKVRQSFKLAQILLALGDEKVSKNWFDDALLINRDPGWYLASSWGMPDFGQPFTLNKVRDCFEIFTQYRITDVLLCIYENSSLIPSESVMWRGDKYLQTVENGELVSYPQLEELYKMYKGSDEDPVQMFLDMMREHGIRPWLSIRMNDAHDNTNKTSVLRDDFFYTAEKNGWMIGEEYGYWSHCLDYSKEPVRTRMLAYIQEVVNKYDMFGLELDFLREMFCFDYKNCPERHGIMNDFMRKVKKIVTQAEKKWVHPIHLMTRVYRSVEDTYEFGFDVELWAREGLVDAVVPSSRWACTDSGIPVAQWKSVVGEKIAVFPGIETLHRDQPFVYTPTECVKAYSAAWNVQGADGLYCYNYFNVISQRDREVYMLHRDNVLDGTRRFVVTFQDISSGICDSYRPLPAQVDGCFELSLDVGPVREEDCVRVIIEFAGKKSPQICGNGILFSEGVRHTPIFGNHELMRNRKLPITAENTFIYECPAITVEGKFVVEVIGKGELTYLEVCIER